MKYDKPAWKTYEDCEDKEVDNDDDVTAVNVKYPGLIETDKADDSQMLIKELRKTRRTGKKTRPGAAFDPPSAVPTLNSELPLLLRSLQKSEIYRADERQLANRQMALEERREENRSREAAEKQAYGRDQLKFLMNCSSNK
jgi:hypothetical protein